MEKTEIRIAESEEILRNYTDGLESIRSEMQKHKMNGSFECILGFVLIQL